MSERGEFCRIHAFYDCPICRGEEVKWVIPIVDRADPFGGGGHVVGVIEIPEGFNDELSYYDVGWEGKGEVTPPLPVAAPPSLEEPPGPDLLETVRAIFDFRNEPRHREAAARGRKVHEDALTLMDADPDISYQEAIEEILQGRGDE